MSLFSKPGIIRLAATLAGALAVIVLFWLLGPLAGLDGAVPLAVFSAVVLLLWAGANYYLSWRASRAEAAMISDIVQPGKDNAAGQSFLRRSGGRRGRRTRTQRRRTRTQRRRTRTQRRRTRTQRRRTRTQRRRTKGREEERKGRRLRESTGTGERLTERETSRETSREAQERVRACARVRVSVRARARVRV